MSFHETDPAALGENPFRIIGAEWMLITAGEPGKFNTMTASWGGLGVLWERRVCFIFVRPTRYTYAFLESAASFSLTFFGETYRPALLYCGTHSGRDTDKVKATGLTPVGGDGIVYFQEARLVLACRKIYHADIDPSRFREPQIETFYPLKDYHRMYVGEIMKCLEREP